MGDDPRAAKRARHACEPCRRKKSRCPGERPSCSYCTRLRQTCVYATSDMDVNGGRSDKQLEDRMTRLEGKMDQLIEQLIPRLEDRQTGSEGSPPNQPSSFDSADRVAPATGTVPNDHQFQELGRLYLKWCHRQPVSLFQKDTFVQSLSERDPELILALKALSLRFPPGSLTEMREQELDKAAQTSHNLVMQKFAHGKIELSTLQTLCILSMVDFAAGRTFRSNLNLSIANQVLYSLMGYSNHYGDSSTQLKELRDCVKSVFVLQNIQAGVAAVRLLPNSSIGLLPSPAPMENGEKDILDYAAKLTEVWKAARVYAASGPTLDAPPPWTSESDYSRVMQLHFEMDTSVPLRHRFQQNRIDQKDPESLQHLRDYWGPWLFLQFVYSVIPCLLNHPFLLSLRLRGFRNTMPHSFIQQSFEQITRFAGWFSHFLDVLEEKQFAVSDPTLAHCVAVVATIHLQHSFVIESNLREKARIGFEKCLNFLRRMSPMWKIVDVMVNNLERLHKSVSVTSTTTQQDDENTRAAWTIDAQLLWDMLIYEKSGTDPTKSHQDLIGSTLISKNAENSHLAEAEFDLIGSVGIYGHKTVPKKTPIYAPNESVTPLGRDDYSGIGGHQQFGIGGFETGATQNNDLFLGAIEYGQAIETWMDLGGL